MGLHSENQQDVHIVYTVQWYVIAIIVAVVLGFLVGVTACVYRCYRRNSTSSTSGRLSSAIKKGLKESTSGSMKKSPSLRSTGSVKSSGSGRSCGSGRNVRSESIGGTGGGGGGGGGTPLMQGETTERRLIKSPSGQQQLQPGDAMNTEYYIEDETDSTEHEEEDGNVSGVEKGLLSPTEKDIKLRERSVDELKASKLGTLQFNVEYDQQKTALVVTIMRASDLAAKDPNIGTSDPYVKLQLLPEKRHKVKTRVVRKTLNPVYDETFTFYGIDFNQLQTITLHFVVLSFDRFSRDDILGEVIMPLSGVDLSQSEATLSKDISPRHIKMHSQGRGELLVSLCYQPAANRLTVVVLKARNLPKMDITGLSDPYVKIYLLYNGQRIAKKKTHVKKRTLNPVFNESFLFDVPCNEGLHSISLEFLVLDWDRMTKNEVIGRLEVGAKIVGPETHHWNEVMNCPRKQIAEWHKLKE